MASPSSSRTTRTWSRATMIVALLLLTCLVSSARAAGECELCGTGVNLKWPYAVLKSDGTTCANMALQAATHKEWEEGCTRERYFWQGPCCGPNRPRDVAITPTRPPSVGNQGSGPHPICELCIGGGFPANDNMVINLLYVGTGTCQMFYDSGLQGKIQGHMCDPLRYFAYEPCGCDRSIPKAPPQPTPSGGGAPSPTPGSGLPSRKDPVENKANVKLSNQRGGAGGQYHGVRRILRLKGA